MPTMPAKPSKPSAYDSDGGLAPISLADDLPSDDDDPDRLVPFTISLPASAVAALSQIAAANGRSRSAEARLALQARLAMYGLAGALPTIDYSTRAKLQRGAATLPAR